MADCVGRCIELVTVVEGTVVDSRTNDERWKRLLHANLFEMKETGRREFLEDAALRLVSLLPFNRGIMSTGRVCLNGDFLCFTLLLKETSFSTRLSLSLPFLLIPYLDFVSHSTNDKYVYLTWFFWSASQLKCYAGESTGTSRVLQLSIENETTNIVITTS
jgi:hypothetical protein